MMCAMAESISQQKFYSHAKTHYMASKATSNAIGWTDEDREHDKHLPLQECKRNPIAFHAKMMGDNMYLQQALHQPDAPHVVDAVI
jgi:hypothetical protein